jgi:hypothetical protein
MTICAHHFRAQVQVRGLVVEVVSGVGLLVVEHGVTQLALHDLN